MWMTANSARTTCGRSRDSCRRRKRWVVCVLYTSLSLEILQITRIKDFEDVGKLAKSDQYFSQVRDFSAPAV